MISIVSVFITQTNSIVTYYERLQYQREKSKSIVGGI